MTDTSSGAQGDAEKSQWMWDILSIQQIVARYVPALDGEVGEVVAGDFIEHGVFDLGTIGRFEGRDEIRAFATRETWQPEQLATIARGGGHFLSPPMIEIDQDEAVATCSSLFFLRDSDHYTLTRLTAVRLELRRIADEWKIVRRFNRLIDETGEGVALYRQAFEHPSNR
ncbi:nuclear transport factor 2 family protein [Nocardia sp. NPDC050713]|uniref:nuclear transport factor 2 family protein n=1 Tax=Nocardia sp. NPDC050713 TaxID=3154511 RepID=UPI0033F523D7